MKTRLILLLTLCLTSSIAFADVVDLFSGHAGPTMFFYELSWIIIFILMYCILKCLLNISKKDTKKVQKVLWVVFVVGIIAVYIGYKVHYKNHPYVDSRFVVSQLEIDADNSAFKQYLGEQKNIYDVKNILSYVNAYNFNDSNSKKHKIIEGINDTTKLERNNRYTIEIVDYYPEGYIKTIRITESNHSGDR